MKGGLEEILRSTSEAVFRGSTRAADHFREVWLARAQAATSGVSPLSLQMAEHLVQLNRVAVRAGAARKRRHVGPYVSELDVLQAMLNDHCRGLRVGFKPSPHLPAVDVGGPLSDDIVQNDSTVLLANHDGLRDIEMSVRKRWMDSEMSSKNPTYVWERLTKLQPRTINAVETTKNAVDEVLELDRRGTEYCVERRTQNTSSGEASSEIRGKRAFQFATCVDLRQCIDVK